MLDHSITSMPFAMRWQLVAGELVAVHIPDEEDEVIRNVCRGRTDAVNEVKRGKVGYIYFYPVDKTSAI